MRIVFQPLSSVKHVQEIKGIIPRPSAQKEAPQIDLTVRSLAKAMTKESRNKTARGTP